MKEVSELGGVMTEEAKHTTLFTVISAVCSFCCFCTSLETIITWQCASEQCSHFLTWKWQRKQKAVMILSQLSQHGTQTPCCKRHNDTDSRLKVQTNFSLVFFALDRLLIHHWRLGSLVIRNKARDGETSGREIICRALILVSLIKCVLQGRQHLVLQHNSNGVKICNWLGKTARYTRKYVNVTYVTQHAERKLAYVSSTSQVKGHLYSTYM